MHLNREERYQIHSLLKARQTISEIARALARPFYTARAAMNACIKVAIALNTLVGWQLQTCLTGDAERAGVPLMKLTGTNWLSSYFQI